MNRIRNQLTCVVCALKANHLERQWAGLEQASNHVTHWDTGVAADLLRFIGAKSVTLPHDFVSTTCS